MPPLTLCIARQILCATMAVALVAGALLSSAAAIAPNPLTGAQAGDFDFYTVACKRAPTHGTTSLVSPC